MIEETRLSMSRPILYVSSTSHCCHQGISLPAWQRGKENKGNSHEYNMVLLKSLSIFLLKVDRMFFVTSLVMFYYSQFFVVDGGRNLLFSSSSWMLHSNYIKKKSHSTKCLQYSVIKLDLQLLNCHLSCLTRNQQQAYYQSYQFHATQNSSQLAKG